MSEQLHDFGRADLLDAEAIGAAVRLARRMTGLFVSTVWCACKASWKSSLRAAVL